MLGTTFLMQYYVGSCEAIIFVMKQTDWELVTRKRQTLIKLVLKCSSVNLVVMPSCTLLI